METILQNILTTGRNWKEGCLASFKKYFKILETWVPLLAQTVKNRPAMQKTRVRFLGQEDLREKG